MTQKEYYEWLEQVKTRGKKYFSDKTAPFSAYLENPEGKFVATITKSQYVFYANIGGDHAFMAADLIRQIRPDMEIDVWGNSLDREEDFRAHNVLVFGYSHYALFSIPGSEMLSTEQYKELEKMILGIKEHNEKHPYDTWELFVDAPENTNIKSNYYEKRIDELLTKLGNYVSDDYEKPNEVIIGRSISENKIL